MQVSRRLVFIGVLCALALTPQPLSASCHRFTVDVSPERVREGESVQVTVARDGAERPSRVAVRTIEGSASAPRDFERLSEIVRFDDEVAITIAVSIAGDEVLEGEETFRVGLSDPSGCVADSDYALSADATVTIVDQGGRPRHVRSDALQQPGEPDGAAALEGNGALASSGFGGDANPQPLEGGSRSDLADGGAPRTSSSVAGDTRSASWTIAATVLSATALILVLLASLRRRRDGNAESR